MHTYSPKYLASVKKYWKQYCEKGEPFPDHLPVIRKEILDSWKRSASAGVKVNDGSGSDLNREDFQKALEENSNLIRIAYPYIQNLYNFVKGTNFLIHLSDKDGRILKLLAEDEQIQNLSIAVSHLQEGSIRTEQLTGTDSTSLCLATHQPVLVMGEEHYLTHNHGFFCSSAPIYNQYKTLIGALTIMGPRKLYQHHTLGMACAAVDGIEKEMRMQEAYDDLAHTNNTLASTIETLDSGVIIMDAHKKILQYNQRTLDILQLASNCNIRERHIYTILNPESIPLQLRELKTNTKNSGFTAITCNGVQIHISLAVSTICDEDGHLKTIVLNISEQKQIHQLVNRLSGSSASYTFDSIIGKSDPIESVRKMGLRAASSASNVLIFGESGTGKELLAQSIHNASKRASGPFIAVNCSSIPKNLISSELFGYEYGAFSGAKKEGNPGKFELADGGTLFLDEIGDMPLELQATLLRVLQTHEITRLGGQRAKKVDVKLLAATNVNLLEAVQSKNFRSDLYYRLNVLSIIIPPLKERKDDIPLLIRYFLEQYNHAMQKNISGVNDEVASILENYDWPGNIRELENIIERAINLAQSNVITVNELPTDIINHTHSKRVTIHMAEQNDTEKKTSPSSTPSKKAYLEMIRLLEQEDGNIKNVAAILNIPPSTLYRKLSKLNIRAKDYRKW